MKFNRPKWDPTVRHVARLRLLYAGRTYEPGDEFPVTDENERRAEQLYRASTIVQKGEIAQDSAGPTIATPPAAARRRKPRARRSRARQSA